MAERQRPEHASGSQTSGDWMLDIDTSHQLQCFLKDMLLDFLNIVKPMDDRLIDHLCATSHLNDVDMESFSGKEMTTPRHEARMVWLHLNRMTAEDFNKDVLPFLVSHYPHIISPTYVSRRAFQEEQTQEGYQNQQNVHTTARCPTGRQHAECVRCGITERITMESMADMLCHHGCLSLDEYGEFVSNRHGKADWAVLFEACRGLEEGLAEKLAENMCALLMKYKSRVPDSFAKLLTHGLPCTCVNKAWKSVNNLDTPKRRPEVNLGAPRMNTWAGHDNALTYEQECIAQGDQKMVTWTRSVGLSSATLSDRGFESREDLMGGDSDNLSVSFEDATLTAEQHKVDIKMVDSQPCRAPIFDILRHGEHFRLLLLGKTGSGKSATGNTIFGAERFTAAFSMLSQTDDCTLEALHNKEWSLEIMDCPGLYDTSRSDEEIGDIILRTVAGMHPGPNAILHVIKLGRYSKDEYDTYLKLKAMFDEHITNHMIVLFTHGDQMEKHGKGKTAEEMIEQQSPDNLKVVLRECGKRYVVFNNDATDPRPQIERLFGMIRDMVDQNNREPYSCPRYKEVGIEFNKEVKRRQEQKAENEKDSEQKAACDPCLKRKYRNSTRLFVAQTGRSVKDLANLLGQKPSEEYDPHRRLGPGDDIKQRGNTDNAVGSEPQRGSNVRSLRQSWEKRADEAGQSSCYKPSMEKKRISFTVQEMLAKPEIQKLNLEQILSRSRKEMPSPENTAFEPVEAPTGDEVAVSVVTKEYKTDESVTDEDEIRKLRKELANTSSSEFFKKLRKRLRQLFQFLRNASRKNDSLHAM